MPKHQTLPFSADCSARARETSWPDSAAAGDAAANPGRRMSTASAGDATRTHARNARSSVRARHGRVGGTVTHASAVARHGTARLRPGVPWRPRHRNGECAATTGAVRRSADRDSIRTSGGPSTLKWEGAERRLGHRVSRRARSHSVDVAEKHSGSYSAAPLVLERGVARSSTATQTQPPWWLAMRRKVPARYPEETREQSGG